MGNVSEAMKKFQAEQAEKAEKAAQEAPPAPEAPDSKPEAGTPPPKPEAKQEPRAAEARPAPRRRTPAPPIGPTGANGYARTLVAYHDRGGRIAEEYRALRTNLLARYKEERFCLLVTSATAAEGKTVTCLNLGFVLAERPERRTVVVDCDLLNGSLARMVGMKLSPGLTDVLRGAATLEGALRPTSLKNLFVVPAGHAGHEEAGELLGRSEIDETVSQLRRQFDYVLLDTPPINVGSQTRGTSRSVGYSTAGILGRATRDALLVVRMNKTPRESVDRAIGLLHAANVTPVGMVLTHQRHIIPEWLYRRI